jgi:hypothetical protein
MASWFSVRDAYAARRITSSAEKELYVRIVSRSIVSLFVVSVPVLSEHRIVTPASSSMAVIRVTEVSASA